jgi:hypothetical protein
MFKHKLQLVVALAVFAGVAVQAAPWFSHNSRRAPKTLTVIGNYKTPRLMADTILSLTSQPYLMISNDGRYFIVMSKDAMEIPKSKLDVYINRLNPKRVVILGDERYVSREQEMNLRKINMKRIPIVRIYGNNWTRIAEELDDMLNIGNLARNFNRNYYDLQMRDPVLRDGGDSKKQDAPVDNVPASMPETLDASGNTPVAEPSEK